MQAILLTTKAPDIKHTITILYDILYNITTTMALIVSYNK